MDLLKVVVFSAFATLACCKSLGQYHYTTPSSVSYSTPSSFSYQSTGSPLYNTAYSQGFIPPSQQSFNYNPIQVHTSSPVQIYRPTPSPVYTSTLSPVYASTLSPAYTSTSVYGTPTTSFINRPGQLYLTPEIQGPAQYSFGYAVQDDLTGNQSGHQETRNGDVTQGSYHVRLPDGRLQRVNYSVQGGSGFVADVSYEGTAQYPITQPQSVYQSPLNYYRPTHYG
ncbi:cuticle protein 19.8-like [Macrobrachium rosenbergii]|uniref:cuticle protein 19.8-like n=1 Tax=Macrobrachium rosenbergii TaxID=79674 RepID=UPI0034D53D93